MASGQRVLVVDEFTDTADVLRAVLEPRGVAVEQALSRTAHTTFAADPLAGRKALSVVVVDQETAAARGVAQEAWHGVPRIFIGTIPVPSARQRAADAAPEHHLAKPFHYADLIRAIDTLIAGQR